MSQNWPYPGLPSHYADFGEGWRLCLKAAGRAPLRTSHLLPGAKPPMRPVTKHAIHHPVAHAVQTQPLSDVRSGLVREQRSLFSTLERARNFEGSSKGYAGEARGANIWATPP